MRNITADDAIREIDTLLRTGHDGPDDPTADDDDWDGDGDEGMFAMRLSAPSVKQLYGAALLLALVPFLFGWLVGKASR
jgi:hypothetical protein